MISLTILGSSSAIPTSERHPTAQVLNISEHFFLIDCGEGTQMQLRKNKIKLSKINCIFISHLHGDHFFGLFGLISTFSLLGRKNDLNIYSHPDLIDILAFQLNRVENPLSFEVKFHFLNNEESELIYQDKNISVTSFPLIHRIPTCGFLFKEQPKPLNIRKEMIERYDISIRDIVKIKAGKDYVSSSGKFINNCELTIKPIPPRSYAYCSDTAYNEKIVPIIKNVDLLFHEATFSQNFEQQAKDTLHSTSFDAAKIAKLASVKKLIIGHFSSRHKDTSELLSEAKSIFDNTECAHDNITFFLE